MERHVWTIEWNDEMSVGIPEIDEDHKQFVFLVNELNRSIADRMDVSEIRHRLQLVIDDAVRHFAREESLFRQWEYPDADGHAIKHAHAIRALQAIKEEHISYNLESEWIDAGLAIRDLLIGHLLNDDLKYAAFYRDQIASGRMQPARG